MPKTIICYGCLTEKELFEWLDRACRTAIREGWATEEIIAYYMAVCFEYLLKYCR